MPSHSLSGSEDTKGNFASCQAFSPPLEKAPMELNPQARMRYAGAKALPVGVQAGVFAFGLALSLVGLPIAVVTALIGRGGTLEVWAKPA